MPRKLGVDQPDYGRMTGRRLLGEGQPLRVCVFVAGRVEPEIVFVLGRSPSSSAATSPARMSRWATQAAPSSSNAMALPAGVPVPFGELIHPEVAWTAGRLGGRRSREPSRTVGLRHNVQR